MGYLIIDHTALHEGIQEFSTTTCGHCSKVIIYATRYKGAIPHKARVISTPEGWRDLPDGYFCTWCDSDICNRCGEQAYSGQVSGCQSIEFALLKQKGY